MYLVIICWKRVGSVTDFCKRISSKDEKKKYADSSSDEEEATQKPASDEEGGLIHHPFKVKDAAIVMDIKVPFVSDTIQL